MASKKDARNLAAEFERVFAELQALRPGTHAHYKGGVVEIITNDYLDNGREEMGTLVVKTSAGDLIDVTDPWFLKPIDPLTQLALEAEEEKAKTIKNSHKRIRLLAPTALEELAQQAEE